MLRPVLKMRTLLTMVVLLTLSCPAAFARGDDWGRGGRDRMEFHGDRHYYRDGRWYRHGWFGFGVAVTALALGAYIESLPPRCSTMVVGGVPYYYDNVYYYQQVPQGGYVVVAPPPVAVAPAPVMVQPPAQTADSTTVNIPNSRGGYTSVTVRRSGTGFVGPQGEFYQSFPSVEQLKTLYGN